jgi:hypothetical protein
MFCGNCGTSMGERDAFCGECGQKAVGATSSELVTSPAEGPTYRVSAQGLNKDFRANGDFGTIEFGSLRPEEFVAKLDGIDNPTNLDEDDLCAVSLFLERDGVMLNLFLLERDRWEVFEPPPGVADEVYTGGIQAWLPSAFEAARRVGIVTGANSQPAQPNPKSHGTEADGFEGWAL